MSGVNTDIVLALKGHDGSVLRMDVLRGVISTSSVARDIDMLSGGFAPESIAAIVTNSSAVALAVEYVVSGGKTGASPSTDLRIPTAQAVCAGCRRAPAKTWHQPIATA